MAQSRELARSGSGHDWPLNGVHEKRIGDTSGWFLWTGEEFPTANDAFVPLHVSHAEQYVPHALRCSLDAGWRSLVAPDNEDVSFDPGLLTSEN